MAYGLLAADSSRPSPPFEIQRLNGPTLRISQLRGSIVALAFIDTTCPHCQDSATLKGIARITRRAAWWCWSARLTTARRPACRNFKSASTVLSGGLEHPARRHVDLQCTMLDQRPRCMFCTGCSLTAAGPSAPDYPGEDAFFRDPNRNIRAELDKLLRAGRVRRRAATAQQPRANSRTDGEARREGCCSRLVLSGVRVGR